MWIILCLTVLLACSDLSADVPVMIDTHTPVQSVLVHKWKFLPGNEALIITDQSDIQELLNLLRNNERNQHACGFHWVFRFQHDLVNASIHRHNQDCQTYQRHNRKIQRLFHSYFTRINEEPSHFLYHIHIDADYEPEVVVSHLMTDDVYIFFFEPEVRWPHVWFRGKATIPLENSGKDSQKALETGEMIINTTIQEAGMRLKEKYSVQRMEGPTSIEGPIYRGEEESGEVVFEFTAYFNADQQLEGVKELLESDMEIIATTISFEYRIQVAFPVRLNAEDMMKLKEKYEFVREIKPFNSEN